MHWFGVYSGEQVNILRFCGHNLIWDKAKVHLRSTKEPVRKEKSLRHFHVTTAVAQPSSCSVAHVYILACSKQKAASSCTFNTNSCTVNTKKEACLHRSGLFKWIIT